MAIKTASESKLAADKAGLAMEVKRRNRAAQELEDCVIRAEMGWTCHLSIGGIVEDNPRYH